MSYAEHPDDILWSYLNAAVESLTDDAVICAHKIDDEDLLNEMDEKEDVPDTVQSIFNRFRAHCNETFYKIVGALAANDFKEVVNLAHADSCKETSDISKLRLYAHLILLIKYGEYSHDETKAGEILATYSKMLIALDMHTLVPFYLSKLDESEKQEHMVDFLYGKF